MFKIDTSSEPGEWHVWNVAAMKKPGDGHVLRLTEGPRTCGGSTRHSLGTREVWGERKPEQQAMFLRLIREAYTTARFPKGFGHLQFWTGRGTYPTQVLNSVLLPMSRRYLNPFVML